jgi:hypothetical protein
MAIKSTEKLEELIKECIIRRLTTQESLDYIKTNGIKLSESTYRRYKKELVDKTEERIFEEGERIHDFEFLRRLDTVREVEKQMWEMYSNTKNEPLKVRILESIRDTQDTTEGYHNSVRWKMNLIQREREKEAEERKREENRRWAEQEDEDNLKPNVDALTN